MNIAELQVPPPLARHPHPGAQPDDGGSSSGESTSSTQTQAEERTKIYRHPALYDAAFSFRNFQQEVRGGKGGAGGWPFPLLIQTHQQVRSAGAVGISNYN